MLHEIKGTNRWCGPAAIAAITGVTTDDAARIIRKLSGRRQVTGTCLAEVEACLGELGFTIRRVFDHRAEDVKPTLAAWLRMRKSQTANYLVEVTGHWVVVRGRKIADSRHRTPVFLRQFRGRRRRVKNVWVVEKRNHLPER